MCLVYIVAPKRRSGLTANGAPLAPGSPAPLTWPDHLRQPAPTAAGGGLHYHGTALNPYRNRTSPLYRKGEVRPFAPTPSEALAAGVPVVPDRCPGDVVLRPATWQPDWLAAPQLPVDLHADLDRAAAK
jgi:hypothetical protein